MPGRRREDTWDDDPVWVPDQGPPESVSDQIAQIEPHQELAVDTLLNAHHRTEDTWDADEPDTGALESAQDGTAQQMSTTPAELWDTSGVLAWDEILPSDDMPPEPDHLPGLQATPRRAASLDPQPPRTSLIQEAPSTLPWPENPSLRQQPAPSGPRTVNPSSSRIDHSAQPWRDPWAQLQRSPPSEPEATLPPLSQHASHSLPRSRALPQSRRPILGLPHGRWIRPYIAPPIPRSPDEVRIRDRTELAALEQVHGRPGPMSDTIFHQFRRGYGVPADIAFDMRARSMIGVYPSSLVYLDYDRLARIPPQRLRSSGAAIPALYWVRILTVKQAPYREHVEHFLCKRPEPCMCQNCRYDREQGTVARPEGRWG